MKPLALSRNAVIGISVAVAAYFLLFWRRLFVFGLIPLDGDLMRLAYPGWAIGKSLFSESLIPLWDPFRNMGSPFLAHPPNQVLYPLRRLFAVDGFLDYVRLTVAAHAAIAAVPAFLLGRKWGGSAISGALAALAVACNGFVIARVTTMIDFAAYAWAPLALWCLVSRRPVALAVTLAFQWLAGLPTFSLLTGVLLAVVAAAEDDRRGAWRCLAVGGGLAAALAAVQVVPFVELLRQSARPVLLSSDIAFAYALTPAELLRPLFYPAAVLTRLPPASLSDPAVVGSFVGPVVTGLAIFGAVRGGRRARILAAAAFVFGLLSLGDRLPIYRFLPLATIFRFPAHWLFPAILVIAGAAALGLGAVKPAWLRSALLVLAAADFLMYAWPAHSIWAVPAVVESKPRELSILGGNLPPGRVLFDPALLERAPHWRMGGGADWEKMIRMGLPSIAAGYGIHEVASRHQLPLKSHVAFVDRLSRLPLDAPLYDDARVSTVISLARAVSNVPGPEDLAVTANPDPKRDALFFESSGRMILNRSFAGRAVAEVDGPGRLVLSETYTRGWRAKIDSAPAAVEPKDEAFPSVAVPSGRHLVEFVYRPTSVVVGAGISVATVAALLAWFLALRGRRRWAKAAAAMVALAALGSPASAFEAWDNETTLRLGTRPFETQACPVFDGRPIEHAVQAGDTLDVSNAVLGMVPEGIYRFQIVANDGGFSRALLDEQVDKAAETGNTDWGNRRISLEELAGRRVTLSFSITFATSAAGPWGPPENLSAVWGGVRIGNVARRPNDLSVILISLDTLRADRLSCYGYKRKTSPTIDLLAETGVRFDQMIAQATWTKPSHMSIFTGTYPAIHGFMAMGRKDRPEVLRPTIAESFNANGYVTEAITASGYVGSRFGFSRGFNRYVEIARRAREGNPAPATFDQAKAFLAENRDNRFFLFFHTYEIHGPHDHTKFGTTIDARYDGGIRYTDRLLKGLINTLHELGRAEDTLVIVTSDHGEDLGTHLRGGTHGHTLYDELLRVPLIFSLPGRLEPRVIEDFQAQSVDIFPTVLDLAGFKIPAGVEGRSLVPYIRGKKPPRDSYAFSEAIMRGPERKSVRYVSGKKRFKYILAPNVAMPGSDVDLHTAKVRRETAGGGDFQADWANARVAEAKGEEFYDLANDRRERFNLVGENGRVLRRLRNVLFERILAIPIPKKREPEKLDADARDELRSLGY